MEQSVALAKDIGRIRDQMEAGADWVPYGKEPWLVTITPRQPGVPQLVVAVSSGKVTPRGVRLLVQVTEGDYLGVVALSGPKIVVVGSNRKRRSPSNLRRCNRRAFPGARVALWRQRIAEAMGPRNAASGEPTRYPAPAAASRAGGGAVAGTTRFSRIAVQETAFYFAA
jgi:hypothetical protein